MDTANRTTPRVTQPIAKDAKIGKETEEEPQSTKPSSQLPRQAINPFKTMIVTTTDEATGGPIRLEDIKIELVSPQPQNPKSPEELFAYLDSLKRKGKAQSARKD